MVNQTDSIKWVPFTYRFEQLAMRWHVAPYQIERELDDPTVQQWVQRGLLFMRLEHVEVKRGR